MDDEALVSAVKEETGLPSRYETTRTILAVLQTLAERISRGQADDLALTLPLEIRAPLYTGGEEPHPFPPDEFVRRVAVRERTNEATAEEHARAVFRTLKTAVPEKEWRDTLSQLGAAYRELVGEG